MVPLVVHVPVPGAYNSELVGHVLPQSGEPSPTRTLPFSKGTPKSGPPEFKLPVSVQVLVPGSYTSALARPLHDAPPATKTCPLGSRVIKGAVRATCMLLASDQV